MAISAVGNGLSQLPAIAAGLSVHPRALPAPLPGCSGRRLPHDSALAMVAVVVASLALALVFGLLALRRPARPTPGSLCAAQSRGREAILTTSTRPPATGITSPRP
jgi:hypothetical protein